MPEYSIYKIAEKIENCSYFLLYSKNMKARLDNKFQNNTCISK